MCGIVGFSVSHPRFFSESTCVAATHTLEHRGPDASGTWVDPDGVIILGHSRLKILDLRDVANQPFIDQAGKLVLVYNGEIYNWRELRRSLEQKGHQFRTEADTEVILALYKEYSFGLTKLLRGMYAFALYDGYHKQLFCSRDPIGEKPFVYTQTSQGFYFASEIPALLSLLPERPAIAVEAIATMLLHNLRHIPDPATAWQSVQKLKPGHSLIVKDGKIERTWRHWHPQCRLGINKPVLRQSIVDAVEMRMEADVPVGLLLSGGIDSTAICSIMKNKSTQPLRTYVLGRDAGDEDVRRARIVADALGTQHTELFFEERIVWEQYCALIAAYGEPVALLPLVYTREICARIKADGISVALCGNGADELFNGYDGQWQRARFSIFFEALPHHIQKIICRLFHWTALLAPSGQRRSALYQEKAKKIWSDLIAGISLGDLDCYIATELEELGSLGFSEYYSDEANFAALLLENQHSLALAADFPAMQSGVELRAPFMDTVLVEQVYSLPLELRVPFFPIQSKAFMKELVAPFVPAAVRNLPKRGFGFGIQEADLLQSDWKTHCEEVILDATAPFLNRQSVERHWRAFLAGATEEASLISRLLSIQLWYTQCVR